ncbi:MAG: chemotaxis protein CheW [Candidatus Ozemobacteraceae bacterium]
MGRIIHLVPKSGNRSRTGPLFSFAVVSAGGKKFAIKPVHLDEVSAGHPILAIPQGSSWLTGVINMRGRIVPVFDLHRRCGLPALADPQTGFVLTFSLDRQYVGFIVEAVEETLREAVGKPVPAPPGIWPGFIATVIPTSEGEFGLIEPERLLTTQEREDLETVRAQF